MSKPLPILQHMPWNVKQLIVNSTDTITKNSLRLVAKEYKNLVTRSPVFYEIVKLVFSNTYQKCTITLVIDKDHSFKVEIRKLENGHKIRKVGEEVEGTIKNGDFFEAIANYVAKLFRNPRAHFGLFSMWIRASQFPIATYNAIKESILKPIHNAVSSLGYLIALENLRMEFSPTNEELHDLLSLFRPGALQNIRVDADVDYLRALPQSQTDLSHVVELEQWKQATAFCGQFIQIRVPAEKWAHFSNLKIEAPELTFDEAKELIEAVMNLNHACRGTVIFQSGISQQLRDHFSPMRTLTGWLLPHHIPILLQDSNTILFLDIESERIEFVRYR